MDKVLSTLRQCVRDWTDEGKAERDSTYQIVIDELMKRFGHLSVEERAGISVLVPGAGLGRLAWEIVSRGFTTQGNEFSFFMLLVSAFILNNTEGPRDHILFPWIHSFSNHTSTENMLRPVYVPNVATADIPPTAGFSMVAGEFCSVYNSEPGTHDEHSRDAVVSCFFLDTAKNIVAYLETIHRVLKPGGVFINIGPLLYHWEGLSKELSVELTLDELLLLIKQIGFDIVEERRVDASYASNISSMMETRYRCSFFVCSKR
ncbi:N2227-like protein [Blyttiomyces helicus]|uniref:carnosine N-methyltransferase n=1 Tax=Blyttiomyces helicus TaxID=388810 RepID=A0A4P9WLX9_9FUNG|nr:N2227-like protein [Blyttiomyces helicus]|eukprot:RKO94061.1 N2227-like protein [Blyttiomyces helicus]